MGGTGSGSWSRSRRTAVEDTRRLDIRYLQRNGLLRDGIEGRMDYNTNGTDSGAILFANRPGRFRIAYRQRHYGGEWEDIQQTLHITTTACHFGGSRKWFICPQCGSRRAVLCQAAWGFACRDCLRLVYFCQQESTTDRLHRRARKVEAKLQRAGIDTEGVFWEKPKGMHWSTFERLVDEHQEAEARSLQGMFDMLRRLRAPV